jgi:hypothetical protein
MLDVEPPREDWDVENWTIDMTREFYNAAIFGLSSFSFRYGF